MSGNSKPTSKKAIGNFFTGGAVQLGTGSEEITKKLGEKSGAYTPTAQKKSVATEAMQQEEATALAEQTQFEQSEEERKKRNSLFQSAGGQATVGGRTTLYGN